MTRPHWLSEDETRNVEFVIVSPGILRDQVDLWYATDEIFIDIFGPFATRSEAVEWQQLYFKST